MKKKQITETSKALIVDDPQLKVEEVFELSDVSKATIKDYKYRIGLFLEFVKEEGFNRNSFLEFKRYLAERIDYTTSTKNKYLATARIFLKELNRQGTLPTDITLNIKGFNQGKKHKKDGLNDEEISRLTAMLEGLPRTPQNTRLKAVISFLAYQGLRQIEIIRLDVKDIDLVSKIAFIQGKGSDDKEPIDLHPETVKHLRDYLKTNKIKDGALFVCRSNNHKNKRLTVRGLKGLVKNSLISLGIEKTVHGFRHYFTTKLIEVYKSDLSEVAQLTRHKSLETLNVYNDKIKKRADLPRYYGAFKEVNF